MFYGPIFIYIHKNIYIYSCPICKRPSGNGRRRRAVPELWVALKAVRRPEAGAVRAPNEGRGTGRHGGTSPLSTRSLEFNKSKFAGWLVGWLGRAFADFLDFLKGENMGLFYVEIRWGKKKGVTHTHTMWVCLVCCAFLNMISCRGWNWQIWTYQENYVHAISWSWGKGICSSSAIHYYSAAGTWIR